MKKAILNEYIVRYNKSQGVPEDQFYFAMMAEVWMMMIADGVTHLACTPEQYQRLGVFFFDKIPYNWDRETIMGVKLFIKTYPQDKMIT